MSNLKIASCAVLYAWRHSAIAFTMHRWTPTLLCPQREEEGVFPMHLAHHRDKQAGISDHILRVKTVQTKEKEREGGRWGAKDKS